MRDVPITKIPHKGLGIFRIMRKVKGERGTARKVFCIRYNSGLGLRQYGDDSCDGIFAQTISSNKFYFIPDGFSSIVFKNMRKLLIIGLGGISIAKIPEKVSYSRGSVFNLHFERGASNGFFQRKQSNQRFSHLNANLCR